MTYGSSDFTVEMTLLALQWAKYSAMSTEMQTMATALGSDTTTHDATIQAPPSALRIGAPQTSFTNDALLVVNKGKAGGVPNASMATIINAIATGGGPVTPPFNFPSSPLAVYSMRKGVTAATQCVKVRRASDNTTQIIGFDSNGYADVVAAQAFAARSTLFVDTWYDQTAGARNLVQATTGMQPQFVVINGKPYIACSNLGSVPGAGPYLQTSANFPDFLSDCTIGVVAQCNSDIGQIPIHALASNGWFLSFGGTGSPGLVGSNPGQFCYYSGGAIVGGPKAWDAAPRRCVAKRVGTAATVYVDGTSVATGTSVNTAGGVPLMLGGLQPSSGFGPDGLIGEVFFYTSALSDTDRLSIDANQTTMFPSTGFQTPYSGTSSIQFGYNEKIGFGVNSTLNYSKANSFSIMAAIQTYAAPSLGLSSVIVANIDTPFSGYALEILDDGFLRARLIADFSGGFYIDVKGSTLVCDGRKHYVAMTYNGSGLASGVGLYVDGVQETATVVLDNIGSGNINTSGQQQFIVGSQFNGGLLYFRGVISHVQVDHVAQPGSFFTGLKNGAIPSVTANTDLCLLLNEGSGTTVHDTSSHTFTGTLTNATMWVP